MSLDWGALADGFAGQASYRKGYSPLYEAIFDYFTEIARAEASGDLLDFDARAFINLIESEWADRDIQIGVESSLVISAAIHAAILADEPEAAGLSRFYSTVGGSYEPEYDRDVLRQVLGGLFLRPAPTLRRFLREGRVQTNEVSRGALWLLAASAISTRTPDVPITLVDLGCSAGLNLAADSQPWRWTAHGGDLWIGDDPDPLLIQSLDFGREGVANSHALPPGALTQPNILARLGFDRNPLHLDDPDAVLLLRACIWGDQPARLARLDRAMAAYRALTPPPAIEAADMIDVAHTLPDRIAPGTRLLLVYNTIVTLYLADAEYAALRANIADAFRRLPDGVRGIWLEHEMPRSGEPAVPPNLCALKLHRLIDGVLTMRYLAYTDAHPQTILLLPAFAALVDDGAAKSTNLP